MNNVCRLRPCLGALLSEYIFRNATAATSLSSVLRDAARVHARDRLDDAQVRAIPAADLHVVADLLGEVEATGRCPRKRCRGALLVGVHRDVQLPDHLDEDEPFGACEQSWKVVDPAHCVLLEQRALSAGEGRLNIREVRDARSGGRATEAPAREISTRSAV
ncbi:hypothetical protein T492DRAFT_1077485, partial [Pavlovales sp. CCMP2436]